MHLQDTAQTRDAMIEACLWMNAAGLNQSTSGNISVQVEDGLLITPSGIPYAQITPDKIVKISLNDPPDDKLAFAPSSEWPFHQRLQNVRSDMPVVLHAHPPYCSVLAVQRRAIPACHYMIAVFGGNDVPLVDYALYGSEALVEGLAHAMSNRHGCIMANHGATVLGETIERAKWRLEELETLARTYLLSSIGGTAHILSDQEMSEVADSFASYGPK